MIFQKNPPIREFAICQKTLIGSSPLRPSDVHGKKFLDGKDCEIEDNEEFEIKLKVECSNMSTTDSIWIGGNGQGLIFPLYQ